MRSPKAADPGLLLSRAGRSLAALHEVLSIHSSDLMHGLHLGVEKKRLASSVILSLPHGTFYISKMLLAIRLAGGAARLRRLRRALR